MTESLATCARCLYPITHPLGLVLDGEGVCSGCRVHEEKDRLDWGARWHRLEQLVQPYRSASGRSYDCIVPVSGANDSYFIVHLVKERLGLNPLLVTYNKYFNTPLGVWNLANLRIRFGCDILVQNVNPVAVKKITRTTLRMFGSIYWHCLAGQTVFPVQTAVRYRVPLIIWGAHQGLEQVGMFSHEHEVEMTRRYRKDHDLLGFEADDLLSTFDTLTDEDIWQFRYPDDDVLSRIGVRGLYLGNYVRWDPKRQHELMMEKYGYRTAQFDRTFDCYDHGDCYNYMGLHDLTKFYKHGYGKALDHACREIRHGRLLRPQAQSLLAGLQGQSAPHSAKFCEWLGVDRRSLDFVLDRHRNPRFWRQEPIGQWTFLPAAPRSQDPQDTAYPAGNKFTATDNLDLEMVSKYITIGKGYP